MLNLNCVICADLFTPSDDVYVTPCGHLFHLACLSQWLERSSTCPQCRNKCTQTKISRVYFNLANLDVSRIDVGSLQEQLDNANLQLKMKEKELNKAEKQVKESHEMLKKCRKTIAGLEVKINKNDFIMLSYVEQIKILKQDLNAFEELRKENKRLTEQIQSMDGVNAILEASSTAAEQLLQNENNPKILAVWVSTLKRELRQSESKKSDIRHVLKVVQSDLRKELDIKRKHEERISQLESENYQMQEKLKALEAHNHSASGNTTVGLNNNILILKEELRRATISPTIKETVKRIEESNSPYLNIKASSVGLAPTLFKRQHGTTLEAGSSTLAKLKISPIKSAGPLGVAMTNSTLRKTTSDLSEKYSIFKKPRLGLISAAGGTGTMKTLSSNYAFNGFGGSEKIDPFSEQLETDDEKEVPTTSKTLSKNIRHRVKTGGLRNFKMPKQ